MAIFKNAYVQGIFSALLDTHATKIANEQLAAQVINQVANDLPEEPLNAVDPSITAELAANLVELSNNLQAGSENAAQAAQLAATSAMPQENEEQKLAAARSFLEKISQGAILTDDPVEYPNPLSNIPTAGYAPTEFTERGKQQDEGKGIIGVEEPQGSTGIPLKSEGNSRLGQTDLKVPDSAQIGKESPHPQRQQGGFTFDESKKIKIGSDEEYMDVFKRLGSQYGQRLPFYLSPTQKVASIQYLMGHSPKDREAIVSTIEKTAELPQGLKDYINDKEKEPKDKEKADKEKSDKEKADKEKADKEKADEEKVATLLGGDILKRLRNLHA